MARMSIDDCVLRDPRVVRLARVCGWNRRETIGCLLDVWAVCYDRRDASLSKEDVDIAAESDGFAEHMIEVGLAAKVGRLVRISGVEERIRYLLGASKAGKSGGVKSGESRRNVSKGDSKGRFDSVEGSANLIPIPIADPTSIPDPASRPVGPDLKSDHVQVIAAFDTAYRDKYQSKPSWGAKQGAQVNRLLKAHPSTEIIRRIGILFSSPPSFLAGSPPDIATLEQHFDKLSQPSRGPESKQQTIQTEIRPTKEL